MAPVADVFWLSVSGFQEIPPSVVPQTPPPAAGVDPKIGGGLTALRIATGEKVLRTRGPKDCNTTQVVLMRCTFGTEIYKTNSAYSHVIRSLTILW
jgi:hypothetical protein